MIYFQEQSGGMTPSKNVPSHVWRYMLNGTNGKLTDVSWGFPVDYQKHEYPSEYDSDGRQRLKKDIFSCSKVKALF